MNYRRNVHSSDSEALEVIQAADGMSALLVAAAVLVTVTGDGDIGEGTRPVIGSLQVNIGPGEAHFVELVPGAPTPKEEVNG